MQAVDPGLVCLPEFTENAAQSHAQAVNRVREALEVVALEGATDQAIAERTSLPLERTRAALSGLARTDEARRLSGLWFGERPLATLRAAVRAYLHRHSIMSVPMFKQLFGVSRKQAIPLLEDLDHRGVTRRQGDERVLGPANEK
jgi:selenocysteine-specific elongation factor